MLRSFLKPLALGAWAWQATRIAVRGFWHEVTQNSSKLHDVLVVKRKGSGMYVHIVEFGYMRCGS